MAVREDEGAHVVELRARKIQEAVAVKCDHLWKIYGPKAQKSIGLIEREKLGKVEILERFGGVVAVADVSLQVQTGEILCIMGLSGSGKSTLIRLINRLIEPTAGTVFIDGEEIGAKGAKALRRLRSEKIAMVFQNVALFPHRTVGQNIAYGLEIRGVKRGKQLEVVHQMLELVQLSGWQDRYPDELSGGMQQRVGLARAFAMNPDILLMDEPFSALDPLIRRQLQDEFLKLSRLVNKTTIFVTHDLEEALRIGDRIAIMRDGQLVQIGTPENIVSSPANEYVSAFVQGIRGLRFQSARSVMEPITVAAVPHSAGDLRLAAQVAADTPVHRLIDLVIEANEVVMVVDEESRPIGTITAKLLLKALKGTSEPK
jgi:glycine betaine/proline transport system ATP-binding protein